MISVIDGVQCAFDEKVFSEEEIHKYVEYLNTKEEGRRIGTLQIRLAEDNPNEVEMNYTLAKQPFERIRRITGYLVGTLDRFNNGKKAEERDRVKHGMEEA